MPIDDSPSVSDERWIARQIVRMHTERGDPDVASKRCPQCQPDGGCRQLTWATAVVSVETPPLTPAELAAQDGADVASPGAR